MWIFFARLRLMIFFSPFFMHDFAFTAYFFRFNALNLPATVVYRCCSYLPSSNNNNKKYFFRLSSRTYESSSICVFVAMYTFSLHKSIIFRITASTNFTCLYVSENAMQFVNLYVFFLSINILKFSANVFRLQYTCRFIRLHTNAVALFFSCSSRSSFVLFFILLFFFLMLLRIHSFFM